MHEIAIEYKRSSSRFASERPTRPIPESRSRPPTSARHSDPGLGGHHHTIYRFTIRLIPTRCLVASLPVSLPTAAPEPPPYKASSLAGEGTVMVPTARQGSW